MRTTELLTALRREEVDMSLSDQIPLSRTIGDLEDGRGVTLFVRKRATEALLTGPQPVSCS
jgi:hypothetical protein